MKFVEQLVPLILSRKKTSTWRIFDDKNLSVGDDLSLVNKATLQEFAKARIVSVTEKTLGNIEASDFDTHEQYESKEKMLEEYRLYYGDKVTEESTIKIIDFKLLGQTKEEMHIPHHSLFESLRKLAFQKGEYAVFGSGPMWVRGIRESNDIDIIVRETVWEWARANGKPGLKEEIGLEYVSFADGDIEVYHDWHPGKWDIDTLIDTAEIIDGIPFVRLDSVIDWKEQKGREKDQKDLALIQKYLSDHAL